MRLGLAQRFNRVIKMKRMLSTVSLSSADLPPLKKPWKNAIAVGRAYELLRADVLEHLAMVQREIGYRYCRFHGLFHDEMAVVGRRKDGSLGFRWHQVDKIYDSLLEMGLRPFVELNGMPSALASGTQTIFDWRLNVSPPKDYAEWGALVEAFARHVVGRYGLEEVRTWYFEVWNEPNLAGFWAGTKEDYWRLYDASAWALKRVDAGLRVGGPASSKANWIPDMIDHCVAGGVPIDFVSTHLYPQDEYVDYRDRAGSPHAIGRYFADTVRRVQAEVASSRLPELEIHWTEWNTLSTKSTAEISWTANRFVDALFGAALVCDLCASLDDAADTLCWWVASDIFEESGMPHSEFSSTYGLLTLNGIPKATFNAFEFLNRLRGEQLKAAVDGAPPTGAGIVATREAGCTQLVLWHREVLELAAQQPWEVALELSELPPRAIAVISRLGLGHGSAFETWEALGCPQTLSAAEHRLLQTHATPAMHFEKVAAGSPLRLNLAPGEVVHVEIRSTELPALPKSNLREALAQWEAQMSDTSRA